MSDYKNRVMPLAQDFEVIYHNEKDSFYVEGSGMVSIGDGKFVATVPVVVRHSEYTEEIRSEKRATESVSHIMRTEDGGKTWKEVSSLPYYSSIPWVYNGKLYVFANKGGRVLRNDDLILLCSEDNGDSWSEPLTLFEGHFWNAHTGMVIKDDKLYLATDDLSFGEYRGPRVVCCDLKSDIMDKSSWRISNPMPYIGTPVQLENKKLVDHHQNSMYLEPNVVCMGGEIKLLVTTKIHGQSTTGLCTILNLEDDGKKLNLSFNQFHPLPGGQLKFFVTYDEKSGLYWAAANLPADGQDIFRWDTKKEDESVGREKRYFFSGNDRRILMLMYSLDGLCYFHAGCIAKAKKLSQSFMYPAIAIDGDDLCVIARTSINAVNRHDADYATFHRIKNFRELAMDLAPEE